MAIKPVEYVKDSSTSGFAVAGDQKTITKENANTIRKDADQGNTKDLDNAQEKYLDGKVDYDTLDYSSEEMGKVGEQQIDTEAEDGEDLSEKGGGKGGAAAATTMTVAGGALFAGAILAAIITGKTTTAAADGFTQAAVGIAGGVAAAGALVATTAFDPNKDERKAQTDKSEENNAIIQQYIDNLNADMDMMNEDVNAYSELSESRTAAQVETITDLGAMQAELQIYQAQGNTAKVAEIRSKMTDVQAAAEETDKEPKEQMDLLKENIEVYNGNNAEASGVKASGDTVAQFLKDGQPMKNMAEVNKYSLYACAIASAAAAVVGFPKLPFFIDAPASIVGKVAWAAAGLVFGYAANKMGSISDLEGAAADAGTEMAGNLENLQANIEGQAGFTEATYGTYGETDEASTETVEENQQATDKANAKNKNQKTKKDDEEDVPVVATPPTTKTAAA